MRTLAIALAALTIGSASLRAQERITDFASEIVVERSGDLVVTERIAVVAEGSAIRRGIYRDFPTIYRTVGGLNRRVAFDVLSVERDGTVEPWRTERMQNGVRVSIGNPDFEIPHGPHTYTLRYRTNRQLVQRPEFDELYWNVTGSQWAFPIDRAVAKISLPAGAVVSDVSAYTGPPGTQGRNWRVVSGDAADVERSTDWSAVIETTAPLAPGDGFTISVSWQKGIVDPGANEDGPLDLALANGGLVLALAGLVCVLIYYVVAWTLVGRDPPRGVIIPLYEPPEGFTPAAARYVAGMGRFDQKSFAAAVLSLAVAGALRIRQDAGKTYTLERGETPADRLPRRQRAFFRELLGTRKTLEVTNTRHTVFQAARNALKKELAVEFEKRLFVRNVGWSAAGIALSLVPALVAFLDAREIGSAIFLMVWLAGWSVGVAAIVSAAITAWRSSSPLSGLGITIFAIPFVAGWFLGAGFLVALTSPWIAGVFAAAVLLNIVFLQLLKAPTLKGRRVMDEIEGFRRYLGVGERDRLNLQNPPDRTPEHYEMFLPFALALDVEQKWAEQFADVLAAANFRPDWYRGDSAQFFSSPAFATSLGSSFSSAIASSSTAPGSSSGGGGGGSSGGGGGGGGGGGW